MPALNPHPRIPATSFLQSGSVDTKMALVLGQQLSPAAPFCERCFDTKAGWRSAEPASVSAVAIAHTLTELLLYVGAALCATSGGGKIGENGTDKGSAADGNGIDDEGSGAENGNNKGSAADGGSGAEAGADDGAKGSSGSGDRSIKKAPPFGLSLAAEDLLDLRIARDAFVQRAAPALTGVDELGDPSFSSSHASLVAQGRRWALHVLEGPWSWALAAAYIAGTVISG